MMYSFRSSKSKYTNGTTSILKLMSASKESAMSRLEFMELKSNSGAKLGVFFIIKMIKINKS